MENIDVPNSTATVMGFTRYEKRENATSEALISASMNWQRDFLSQQEGVVMHSLLGNLKGQFADAILAVDSAAYANMTEQYMKDDSAQALMALIEPESIRPAQNLILKQGVQAPSDFSCIEFGTFQTKENADFSESKMLAVSKRLEEGYIAKFPQSREHFLSKVDEDTYSEIAFVQTMGAAREICNGYLEDSIGQELLSMLEPTSFDLDFWFVLV
ncbi:MAG: hypothetical protein AAFV85_03245 [Cyanobacteria bacterium J06634_6]